MTILFIAYGAICGGILGSFLNAAIPRRHELKTLITTRSYCPICRTQIKGYDNIPVISWFLLKGKCRSCSSSIPVLYTYLETGLAGIGAIIGCSILGGTLLEHLAVVAIWALVSLLAKLVSSKN